jgi:hypothetical protein
MKNPMNVVIKSRGNYYWQIHGLATMGRIDRKTVKFSISQAPTEGFSNDG